MTAIRLISIVLCALLISCTGQQPEAQGQAPPGPIGWVSDITYLLTQMEQTHPDLYHRHTRAEWQAEASRLGQTLMAGNESEAILGFCRLVALAADGQTRVIPPAGASFNKRWLPLAPERYADGWYVRAAQDTYVPIMGLRLLEVGGVPIDSIVRGVRPLVSADNAIGALEPIAHLMRNAAVLDHLGAPQRSSDSVLVTYADVNGTRRTRWVQYTSGITIAEGWYDAATAKMLRQSLYQRLGGNYAYTYLPDDRLLYVKFNGVRDDDSLNVAEFFERVYSVADSADVQRFAIDIRNDHGDDSAFNEPVLHGLITSEKLNVPGKVFVIIGRGTYASGMSLAVALEHSTPAVFMGEPTGGRPNWYGNPVPIKLPQSGITVECSSLNRQNSDPRDKRPWITPDFVAQPMWGDFFYGVDPPFQAVRMIDYNHLKRLFPATGPGPTTADRVYSLRWQRDSQIQTEQWPSLLGP